jgi:hypothetical protein
MTNVENITPNRPQAQVDRPDEGDLEMAIHGLNGIFWALNMLAVQDVGHLTATKSDIRTAVADLIVAGGIITNGMSDRF